MKNLCCITLLLVLFSCNNKEENGTVENDQSYIVVLGIAQDAGYPQIACEKVCCQRVYDNPTNKRLVSSIALVDPISMQAGSSMLPLTLRNKQKCCQNI